MTRSRHDERRGLGGVGGLEDDVELLEPLTRGAAHQVRSVRVEGEPPRAARVDVAAQANAAWEAAVCWGDSYSRRRLAEVRPA